MAEIPLQSVSVAGTILTEGAAAAGDTAQVGANKFLIVENNSGATITVTVAVPGNDQFGNPVPDLAVPILAGKTVVIPLQSVFGDPAAAIPGQAVITYSATATVVRSVIAV
jgi:hypothetical protein